MAPAMEAPPDARPVRRALFVDRDGTLNPDLHYLKDSDRLELFRGVGRALALAHAHGYLVVCVTNQSGVGRGIYSTADVDRMHARLNGLLAREGTRIDAFYYCPHAPEENCRCRKPGTGLFADARRDLNLDFGTSAIIGDRVVDVEAGRSIGLVTALVVPPGHKEETERELAAHAVAPEIRAGTLEAAVARILARG